MRGLGEVEPPEVCPFGDKLSPIGDSGSRYAVSGRWPGAYLREAQ